jgi:pimeloyl-ACP methyl ester carboxylesterase
MTDSPWSSRGHPHAIEVDGLRIHAVDWSPREPVGSRRVLLVHGLGAHTLSWEPFAGPLASRLDATVTAVDLVGFGRTRAPERSATLATNRRVVTAVLDQTGPATVIGNSMGATIGIGVAAARPDLVDALVLVNPAVPHPRPGAADWLRMLWLAPVVVPSVGARLVALRAARLGAERLVDTSLQASLTCARALDTDLRHRMVELTAERLTWPEVAPAYADAARSLVRYLTRGIHRDLAVAAATTPILLIHGSEDQLVPLLAARHAARLHGLELHVLEGVGHAPQLEVPDRLLDAVESWSTRAATPAAPYVASPAAL